MRRVFPPPRSRCENPGSEGSSSRSQDQEAEAGPTQLRTAHKAGPRCSACASRLKPPPEAGASRRVPRRTPAWPEPPAHPCPTETPRPSRGPALGDGRGVMAGQGGAVLREPCPPRPAPCPRLSGCLLPSGPGPRRTKRRPGLGRSRVSAHSKLACFYFSICKHRSSNTVTAVYTGL